MPEVVCLSYNSVDVWLILFLRGSQSLCVDIQVVSQYFTCLSTGRLTHKFSFVFFVVSNNFKPSLNHYWNEYRIDVKESELAWVFE